MRQPDPSAVGLRLRAILRKLDLTIDQTATQLQMPRSRFSNNVNGYALPQQSTVYALTKLLPGLTLEWVYFGDDRLVPATLSRELSIFAEAIRQGLDLSASEARAGCPDSAPARSRQGARAA